MKLAQARQSRVQVRVIAFDENGKIMHGSKAFFVYEATVDAVVDVIRRAVESAGDVPDDSSRDAKGQKP